MKVEIKVLPEAKEPYAVIYASEITPEIRRAVALLEKEIPDVIPVKENDSIIVLRPDEIYMVRVENEKTVVYTKTKRYDGGKRLATLAVVAIQVVSAFVIWAIRFIPMMIQAKKMNQKIKEKQQDE